MKLTMWLCLLLLASACGASPEGTCVIERRGTPSSVVRVSGSCQGSDFEGLDLSQADVEGLDWSGVTCPDGTTSAQNGGTCQGHLDPDTPPPDMGSPDLDAQFADAGPGDTGLDQGDQAAPDLPSPQEDAGPEDTGSEDVGPEDVADQPDAPPEEESGCQALGICQDTCLWSQPGARPTARVTTNMIAGDWTLEVWFYLDERPAQPLTLLSVDLSELVAGRDLLALQINTDQHPVDPLPRVELQVGRQERAQRLLANDAPVPLRRWVHVAVDSRYNIYLDGWSTQPDLILPQGAQDPVDLTTLYGRAGWHLGLRGSPTEWSLPWNGALRGARVSRGLLYQQNFAPPHPLGTGGATVHVWAMDEGSGTLLRDTQNMQDVPIIDATWSACP